MASDTLRDELVDPDPSPPAPPDAPARRPHWWLQLLLVSAFYWLYARIRDIHGLHATDPGPTRHAYRNGLGVLHVEQWLHIDVERAMQQAVLHLSWLLRAANVFYGSAHFGVTLLVFLWLLSRNPPVRFCYWRNVLAVGTLLALVGFAIYPTMPPRLFPATFGYIDTLHSVGGLWSYNAGVLEHISDPYAAMPSLHIVWATWCSCVLWQRFGHRVRRLLVLYPLATCLVVLVSANHWVLDLVVGWGIFLLAWGLVHALTRAGQARGAAPAASARGEVQQGLPLEDVWPGSQHRRHRTGTSQRVAHDQALVFNGVVPGGVGQPDPVAAAAGLDPPGEIDR